MENRLMKTLNVYSDILDVLENIAKTRKHIHELLDKETELLKKIKPFAK